METKPDGCGGEVTSAGRVPERECAEASGAAKMQQCVAADTLDKVLRHWYFGSVEGHRWMI
jgi:hypothetical protein